jgi:hypothetical protein
VTPLPDFHCPHKNFIRSAVYGCLHASPKTSREIEIRLGLKADTVQTFVAELIALEMIREADKRKGAILYAVGL